MTKKYTLQTPIEFDGKTISEVTIRQPRAKDLIALGDHFAVIGKLGSLRQVDEADEAAVAAAAATASAAMNRETFEAMTAFAAHLADLGDAAGELAFPDLVNIMSEAASGMGEAVGRGLPESGA